jgi:hypothetical protein
MRFTFIVSRGSSALLMTAYFSPELDLLKMLIPECEEASDSLFTSSSAMSPPARFTSGFFILGGLFE